MRWFNRCIVGILPLFPKSFVWIFSRRYVAGKTLADGVAKAKSLNADGCLVTIDVLGEDISRLDEAEQAKRECMAVLEAIRNEKLNGNLSLKLSQLGLKLDTEACYRNVREVVQKASELGQFVRIDMEDSSVTDATLSVYRRLRAEYKNVGAVIQAYLKRSEEDVEQLIREGIAHLRICKGIYDEPAAVAYKDKAAVREKFIELSNRMFETGSYVGLATHDKVLVRRLLDQVKAKAVPSGQFEFQMLLGVTEKLRANLVAQGYPLRVYVPFGEHWYAYSMRRLKENPQMAGHILKNLFIRN